jgi:hypothetical protein
MPKPSLSTDPVRELAERPGEEAAFESALRADLEEERRRMEDLERQLEREGQPEQPRWTAEEPLRASSSFQTASERRWWEFWR